MQNHRILFVIVFLAISLNSFCIYNYVSVIPEISQPAVTVRTGLKTGDVIFRRGKGVISHWFAKMSPGDPYFSHAGVVLFEDGRPTVISSTQDHIPSGVISQELKDFLNPENTEGYAVYRYDQLDEKARDMLAIQLRDDLHHNLPFDASFELANDSAYYCTEYLYSRLNRVVPGMISSCSTSGEWKYIAPEDLYKGTAGNFLEVSR